MDYRLLIDLEALEILDNLPKRVRSQLLSQFQKIRDFPTNYSDYYEYDAVGRRVAICISAGWAIHYWIDSADGHVKVLALTPAGRYAPGAKDPSCKESNAAPRLLRKFPRAQQFTKLRAPSTILL